MQIMSYIFSTRCSRDLPEKIWKLHLNRVLRVLHQKMHPQSAVRMIFNLFIRNAKQR